ncbi:MAG: aspartate aminotransferase family protein [Calditrichaeota bacterium]|nr:aspartate aminotransferase family protein [Calditrichota bacterium]
MHAIRELEDRFSLNVYPKRPLVIVKGEGARVWDDQGRVYIDCVSGNGVANIGHANPAVIEAITRQAQELITCPGIFYNPVRARLLEKLVEIAPDTISRTFLCNSGAESIEAAIKFARYTTGKTEILCATRGFHGRTLGALSATHHPKHKKGFGPLVPGFRHVPFNRFDELVAHTTKETAAVLLEIVQGEGGVHVGHPEYFQQVQELCRQRDILLIIDEVQTGFCRTGKMFACEHFDLQPDILCVAKAIAGGLPMGAVLCSERIQLPVGAHGSTFGGNPLVCAAAHAAIDFMVTHKLDQQAAEKGQYLVDRLHQQDFPIVREIRHLGLMIGIELRTRVKPYILKLLDAGVLALPAGRTVLRLLPPLTISYPELDIVVEALVKVLKGNEGNLNPNNTRKHESRE